MSSAVELGLAQGLPAVRKCTGFPARPNDRVSLHHLVEGLHDHP